MTGIEFSPSHQRVIDAGRATVEQKVLREAECVDALHEMHLNGNGESVRLATEALHHAQTMTAAAFMELYLDFRQMAREEIEAEQTVAA